MARRRPTRTPNPAILLAQATGLAARAAGMAHNATAPELRAELQTIELNARECRFYLQEAEPPDAGTLDAIVSNLDRQAARLDELEDRRRRPTSGEP